MGEAPHIGVLAVQGNFRARGDCGGSAPTWSGCAPDQLGGLDGLVVPGGESTAIRRLMRIGGLEEPVFQFRGCSSARAPA